MRNDLWVSIREGAKLVGISHPTFRKYALQGRFATQQLPGLDPRYSRADIERFAAEHTKAPTLAGSGAQ